MPERAGSPPVESEHPRWQITEGDCRDVLGALPAGSVHTCVTSPPYFGLRDYGNTGQIGLEPTPDEFVAALVAVFRAVRRVLRDDGTVWLNLGDSYASGGSGGASPASTLTGGDGRYRDGSKAEAQHLNGFTRSVPKGYKPKDLLGIPWMVAFALRADGWYLRSDIIWAKPNPMPESVTDRPTKAHEYLFLLSKGPRYYFDADAIRESWSPASSPGGGVNRADASASNHAAAHLSIPQTLGRGSSGDPVAGRNKRSVWIVATQPYPGAHFATFPPKLIEPCILAGCPEGGMVLDPFAGAGTTGVVALRHSRDFIGIELNAEYAELARPRLERYWRDEPRAAEAPQPDSLFTLGDAA